MTSTSAGINVSALCSVSSCECDLNRDLRLVCQTRQKNCALVFIAEAKTKKHYLNLLQGPRQMAPAISPMSVTSMPDEGNQPGCEWQEAYSGAWIDKSRQQMQNQVESELFEDLTLVHSDD